MEKQEIQVNGKKSSTKDFLLGAFVGGLVGAAAAFLFSPKAGKEIRGTLTEFKDSAFSKSGDLVTQVRDRTKNLPISMKSSMNDGKDQGVKEEQPTDFVPIKPYVPSHEELQRKIEEAEKALEEEELKMKA
ncbi:YtxH domain-containing protein [Pseudoneobacillus sp. C159]